MGRPRQSEHSHYVWSLDNERQFLATIGNHAPGKFGDRSVKRRKLLEGYLDALDTRTQWGHLDKESLRAYALQMLSELK